jgi:hypothetical protein
MSAAKRATKTSTLGALRSVNAALRMAVGCVSQSSNGRVERDDETGRVIRFVSEELTIEKKIEHVDLALEWLHIAELRSEHAKNHLYSYRARLVERQDRIGNA